MDINGNSIGNQFTGDVNIDGDLEVDGDLIVDGAVTFTDLDTPLVKTNKIQTLAGNGDLIICNSATSTIATMKNDTTVDFPSVIRADALRNSAGAFLNEIKMNDSAITVTTDSSTGLLVNNLQQVQVSGAYYLPDVVGTVGEILTSNAAGVATWSSPGGSGDVNGPASAVDSNLASYDGITGKLIKDSAIASSNVFLADGSVPMTGDINVDSNEIKGTYRYLFDETNVLLGDVKSGSNRSAIVIGNGSGNITAAGVSNIFIGLNIAPTLTSGNSNVGLGSGSLNVLTSGSDNLCLGSAAGSGITSGGRNTLIGPSAGIGITSSSSNICIGYNSNVGGIGVIDSVAIGENAIANNTGEVVFGSGQFIRIRAGTSSSCDLGSISESFKHIYGAVTALKSATTSVDVSASPAPTVGQVLKATSSTTATWQTDALGGDVVGPASAVDSNLASYNTTTGKLIKDSAIPQADVFLRTGAVAMTGSIRAPNGTTALPSYSFTNFTGSGLSIIAGPQLNLSTGGVQRLAIVSTGIVASVPLIAVKQLNPSTCDYSFFFDGDTGMRSPAADSLTFTTGGVDRFNINSTGQIDCVSNPLLNVASSTATTSFYESLNVVSAINGAIVPAGSPNITVRYARVGKRVTISWDNGATFNGTGTSSAINVTTAVLDRFRPSETIRMPCSIVNNGVTQVGIVQCTVGGLLNFFGDQSLGSFTGTNTESIYGGSISFNRA